MEENDVWLKEICAGSRVEEIVTCSGSGVEKSFQPRNKVQRGEEWGPVLVAKCRI